MKRSVVVIALFLSGCASVQSSSPEVARLQAFADSIEPGWRVESGWAHRGYLGNMYDPQPGYPSWMRPPWNTPTIYLRDEVIGTRCADVIVAGLFARRQSGIPFTFGQTHVAKEAREILAQRGWSPAEIRAAWASCPTELSEAPARN